MNTEVRGRSNERAAAELSASRTRHLPLAFAVAATANVIAGAMLVTAGVPVASTVVVAVLGFAAAVDLIEARLPDSIVGVAAVLFVAIVIISRPDLSGTDLGVGIALFAGPLLALHLISPDAMGFGDIKAAVVLGAAIGAVSGQLAVAALALAAGGTASVAIATRRSHIPFGPGLVLGAGLALTAHRLVVPSAVAEAISLGLAR